MSLSIQVKSLMHPKFSRFVRWAASTAARRKARLIEIEAVKHLRRFDSHLLRDIDVNGPALWQPRPEILLLHTPYVVTTQRNGDGARLLV